MVYCNSFGIEYIPQEVLDKIKDKSIFHNIFRTQDNDYIMCGFYCVTFSEYVIVDKALSDYTNLFSPNDYKKIDQTIYFIQSTLKTNMTLENLSLDFRLKNIDEARDYLLDKVKHNGLMNEGHKNVCRALNYLEHFLDFVYAARRCVLVSSFTSLVGFPIGIASSAVGIKYCATTAGIKKYILIIKKKKKSKT